VTLPKLWTPEEAATPDPTSDAAKLAERVRKVRERMAWAEGSYA
jgi:hypothetical protein